MEKEFEMFNQIQDVIKNAANTIEKLIEAKKERDKVKRDWEIVSFKSHGLIYNLMDWRKYRCYTQPTFAAPGHEVSQEWALQQPEFSIHSVRRLSDNEVFSVGEDTTYGKIDRFIISRGEIEVHFTNGNGATLASISKLPQRTKLFTTEDGKDLYDRSEEVFGVHKESLSIVSGQGNSIGTWINGWYTTYKIPNPTENDQNVLKEIKEKFVLFSSEEKRKEYVTLNKPLLSVADILGLWVLDNSERLSLIELAKSKQS